MFLVDSFQHSNLRSLSKIWQKLHKNFEIWKILGFLSFSVWIWYIFHLENSHYLFGKAYWTTNSCHSCHVERFQHSNPRSLSKIWQKLHKNDKNRKILEFFFIIFGVIFFWKNAFISLKNTIGQRIRALLNIFNIIIHDVYRKNDKNCIKTLKVKKIWKFCHFFGNFSFKKPHVSLQNTIGQRIRALLNVFNILIDDVYRKNGKKCTKTVKIGKVLNFCHFRVIMGSFPSFPKKSKNLYKYISHGTKLMSVEFCECTSSYYVNNISWQIL